MSDFSDYKFDNLHLPPAGLSSGRLKHHWGKDTWTTPYVDFSLIQMPAAPEDNTLVGSRSMIDPAGYNLPAGTRSERVLHRKDYGMNDWECDDPKEFASKVKMKRSDDIRKFKIYCPQPRAKAVFSKRNHAKTDPITHFGTIYGDSKSAVKNYRPGRRYGYKNEAASNNWTWRQDKASLDHMSKHNTALTKTEQKFQVSVRGERQYNVCGTEDLLPAATVGFVKCDVPPPREYITANDKKYLPFCARPFDSDAFINCKKPPNIANESQQVWNCMRQGRSEVGAKDIPVKEASSRGSVRSEISPSESSFISQNSTAVAMAGDMSRGSRPVSAGPVLRDRSLRPKSSGPTMRDRSRRHALQQGGGFPERKRDKGKASQFRNSDPAIRRSVSAMSNRRSRSTGSLVSCRSQPKLMMRRSR